jgi:hypothetical protein
MLQIPGELEPVYDGGDAIFLCAPQANPALKRAAAPFPWKGKSVSRHRILEDIEVPCWFADYTPHSGERSVKAIWISSNSQQLESGAEFAYQECESGQRHELTGSVRDYAIMLRLKLDGRGTIFVVAGIHQYGTWIAGEFLHTLSREYHSHRNCSITPPERSILLQDYCDIAAVVTGDFDEKKLIVENPKIYDNCLWFRGAKSWHKIEEADWENKLRALSDKAR